MAEKEYHITITRNYANDREDEQTGIALGTSEVIITAARLVTELQKQEITSFVLVVA